MQPEKPEGETTDQSDRGLMSFMQNVASKVGGTAPPSTPQIDADVAAIEASFKGIGTKEDQLIAVLCQRSREEIQRIRAVYNWKNTVDLLSKVQLETSGRFQRLFESLLATDAEFRATLVNRAVKGIGTDEMLLIDVILTCSNEQIEAVKAAYKKMFLLPMQLRVDLDTSGKLQSNLDALLNNKRPARGIDQANVQADLDVLFKATEGRVGTDEKAVSTLVATRSRDHLVHLNKQYATRSPGKKTFVETIKAETSGWAEKSYVANFLSPAEWHAWRLHKEMAGLGTDEEGLLRSILLPSPLELKQAAKVLKDTYKEDLNARVRSELWGNLKNALTTYVAYIEKTVQLPVERSADAGGAAAAPAAGGAPAAAEVSKKDQKDKDKADKKEKKDKDKDEKKEKKDKGKKGEDSGGESGDEKKDKKDKEKKEKKDKK